MMTIRATPIKTPVPSALMRFNCRLVNVKESGSEPEMNELFVVSHQICRAPLGTSCRVDLEESNSIPSRTYVIPITALSMSNVSKPSHIVPIGLKRPGQNVSRCEDSKPGAEWSNPRTRNCSMVLLKHLNGIRKMVLVLWFEEMVAAMLETRAVQLCVGDVSRPGHPVTPVNKFSARD